MLIKGTTGALFPHEFSYGEAGLVVAGIWAGHHVMKIESGWLILESGCLIPSEDIEAMRLIYVKEARFIYQGQTV